MSAVYYNDNDPFIAAWLRELIKAGQLPEGEVDERSILDVEPADLRPFRQCHFFAGIGGWPHALRLAGWLEDREVWTASLPCQPLSVAGKRAGHADERHLWPAFYRLVEERRPAILVGEQVASKDAREWLVGIRADLEHAGYACGAANLPACAVSAPHRRERLYWGAVADAVRGTGQQVARSPLGDEEADGRAGWNVRQPDGDHRSAGGGESGGVEYASSRGSQGNIRIRGEGERRLPAAAAERSASSFWDNAEWRVGADGKARRVGAGIRLLAYGVPNRVGRLRGYGNAIVPQVAAEFVKAIAI